MVLDPNDLAAKGATLLHHLAVWMLEEKRMTEKEGEEQPVSLDSKDPSGQPPGLVTNSIVLLFSIKDWCKKVCFQQTNNQGLRQLLLTVSWDFCA